MRRGTASDDSLVHDMRNGDQTALACVIDRYAAYVAAIVWSIVQGRLSSTDVEEIVSDVFLALWQSADRVQRGKLKGFLSVIARRRAINALRRVRPDEPLEEDELPIAAPGPEEEYLRRAEHEALRRTVEALPEPDRTIFLQHYYYCKKTAEIASSLGMNVSTVQMRLWRGRERLRRELTEGGYFIE